ncbi:hypothetical protein LC612_31100 [Nostoc sp. CHAB 5834]|nr:hypothetical protein [Nostoc sp. CHAB 5834]
MVASRKGGLTGSSRVKNQKSVGDKAKEILDNAVSSLSTVANKTVEVQAQTQKTAGDVAQTVTPGGYQKGFQSSNLDHKSDVYGGLAFPVQNFSGMIPSDLLNPQIELQATEEQKNIGLATYRQAENAQFLLQAGFKYIEEIGKTKQQYHKAEQSVIKASTEGIKTQQEVVNFDIASVNLDINREKLLQTDEKLVQERITTQATRNETQQLRLFYEAKEQKRDTEITRLKVESQTIIQKYLQGKIS